MPYIYGRNPILEALRHQKPIQKIYVQHGQQNDRIRKIFRIAREQRIPVTNADSNKIIRMVGKVAHQGVVALISPIQLASLNALIKKIPHYQSPFTMVIADQIQDPHNMGAIIRSAEIFGATGIITANRDSVPITDTVVKASAGAALHLPVYQTHNLSQAVRALQKQGVWIIGSALGAKIPLWKVDFKRNCAIIIGNEEKGMRPALQKNCDTLFYIPQAGKTQSLNASVAAGITLAEIVRQRT